MKTETLDKLLNQVDAQIIRALLYYDIFNYPLTVEEIFRFLGVKHQDESIIRLRLESLCERKTVYSYKNLFGLKSGGANAERRLKGNVAAEKFLLIAKKKANLISKFPFVRGVFASGSLSKGYMDENSDLDFFIVTEPNRLWIARTLLVMYKRIFLFNSHKYFCVNYFVDDRHLEIEEKNLFTATELATVIPLYGSKQYERLHKANPWLTNFFPNYVPRSIEDVPVTKISWIQNLCEKFLNVFFADALEHYFQEKTILRWRRQYEKHYAASDFKIAFKSKAYASKNHPRNFQRSVIEIYREKLKTFGLDLNPARDEGYLAKGSLVNTNYPT